MKTIKTQAVLIGSILSLYFWLGQLSLVSTWPEARLFYGPGFHPTALAIAVLSGSLLTLLLRPFWQRLPMSWLWLLLLNALLLLSVMSGDLLLPIQPSTVPANPHLQEHSL